MAELLHSHPDLEQLRSFSLGKLDDEAASGFIEAHLETCAECRHKLETVAGDTLEGLVRSADPGTVNTAPPLPLTDHPRYEIQKLLGTGGMGTIYQARHKLMDRDVALKVIHPALVDRPGAVERFRREVRAAARLTHPNIVTAHDADQAGDCHFLIMEYVPGQSLAQVLAERGPLPVAEACAAIRQAALGLQYAHEQGMVHRDIKPANLMVTAGTVKILDFGLARFASELGVTGGSPTQDGSVVGTPDYMAPEQADDSRKADIRADIYSLGCTLYHLLAGQAPFPTGTMMQKLRAHQEQAPRPLAELRPDVPVEVVRVVARMMAKDPVQRYQTPAEVAQALAPFVSGTREAPERRKRRPVVMVAAALLGLIGGGLLLQEIIIRIRDRSGNEHKIEVGKDSTVVVEKDGKQVFPPPANKNPKPPPDPPDSRLDRLNAKNIPEAERLPDQPKGLVAVLGERRWPGLSVPNVSPDGKRIAAVSLDAKVILSDLTTGREIRRFNADLPSVWFVAFSPTDNNLIACANGYKGSPVILWDLATEKARWSLPAQKGVLHARSLCWNADGRTLATARTDGTIKLWDTVSQKETGILKAHGGWPCALYTPDGKTLIYEGADKSITLWDVATRKEKGALKGHAGEVASLAVSPDSKILASGHAKDVWLWDLNTQKPLATLSQQGGTYLAFSPDGRTLAGGGARGGIGHGWFDWITLWDVATKERRVRLSQHDMVLGLAFSPDGRTLFSGCWGDGVLRRWDVKTGELIIPSRGHASPVMSVAITPDGRTVASLEREGVLKLWDLVTGKEPITLQGQFKENNAFAPSPLAPLAFSPDGQTLASGLERVDQRPAAIQLWDVRSRKPLQTITTHGRPVTRVAFSPNSRLLASVGTGDPRPVIEAAKVPGEVKVWEVNGGKPWASLPPSVGHIVSIAFAADNNILALGGEDGSVKLWDVAAGKELSALPGHGGAVTCLAFSPDGGTLATGSKDQTVRTWDLAKRCERELFRHVGGVASVAFTPDGKALLWVGNDGKVVRQVLGGAQQEWHAAPGCLAADGRHLLYGTEYGTIYILRLRGR
jgi:WD40 repeat protein/serine/threonine protein kinase